jgi:hypothetical protein
MFKVFQIFELLISTVILLILTSIELGYILSQTHLATPQAAHLHTCKYLNLKEGSTK